MKVHNRIIKYSGLGAIITTILVMIVSQDSFGQRASRSTADVYRFSDNSVVEGATSTLVRKANGVTLTVRTNDLPPGAYTVWWVVENYPEFCSERPCTLEDEENPLVQASVLLATGHVVSESGIGNFAAWLGVGGPYRSEILFGPGLLNPIGADIYPVIRYHGPVIPGSIKQQLTTFDGGCLINICSDEQTAFHISD